MSGRSLHQLSKKTNSFYRFLYKCISFVGNGRARETRVIFHL